LEALRFEGINPTFVRQVSEGPSRGSPVMHQTYVVDRAEAGQTLGSWLRLKLKLGKEAASRLLTEQRVRVAGSPCRDPMRKLFAGQRIEVRQPDAKRVRKPKEAVEPIITPAGPQPRLVFADGHLIVVDKPPGLTTMRHASDVAEFGSRARRFLPATLADLVPTLLPPGPDGRPVRVRAVHRLDKETSGLIVFARTAEAERLLGKLFRVHATDRRYRAIVRGRARNAKYESWFLDDRGDGRRGSGPPGQGKHAVTHVRVVEELGDYTLVECRLETGRTHQVRIHLGEAGTPLCGERIYDRPRNGRPLPDGSGAARVELHAARLAFKHPIPGQRIRWSARLPKDLDHLVRRLRHLAKKTARRAMKPPKETDKVEETPPPPPSSAEG
jgi:23S rRNA pseudouridine1911/1915/1917 synthase